MVDQTRKKKERKKLKDGRRAKPEAAETRRPRRIRIAAPSALDAFDHGHPCGYQLLGFTSSVVAHRSRRAVATFASSPRRAFINRKKKITQNPTQKRKIITIDWIIRASNPPPADVDSEHCEGIRLLKHQVFNCFETNILARRLLDLTGDSSARRASYFCCCCCCCCCCLKCIHFHKTKTEYVYGGGRGAPSVAVISRRLCYLGEWTTVNYNPGAIDESSGPDWNVRLRPFLRNRNESQLTAAAAAAAAAAL